MKEVVHKFWYALVRYQLKFRYPIIAIVAIVTAIFIYNLLTGLEVYTDFFELYPPKHPYIKLYKDYRKMFGSANVLSIVLERQGEGEDIYHPETMRKLNELTLGILKIKGVNPLQVASPTHPKIKQIVQHAYGIAIYPLVHPSVHYPKTPAECERFRKTVYSQEGIRGFYISIDDKAAAVYAGFWEEGLDFDLLFKEVHKLAASVEDENHKIYITGYPMLYAWLAHYKNLIVTILLVTLGAMLVLLVGYFRTVRGVIIPVISGLLAALWGLGFAGLMGFNLDPLLLVVPVLLSARALSHSCQCLERYRQEFFVTGDTQKAIVKAYSHMYPAAMLAIVTDGVGVLTIAIATIPLMQKLAYISSFWIISIFIAVVILNPIMLSFLPPPKLERLAEDSEDYIKYLEASTEARAGKQRTLHALWSRAYEGFTYVIWRSSAPKYKWLMFVFILLLVIGGGVYTSTHLKVGDSSAGGAILYPDHPYNVAAAKVNRDFVGASRLIVVVRGKEKKAIRDRKTLETMEKLGLFMQEHIDHVGGTVSLTDLVRRINRNWHDGSPKWEMIPDHPKHLGQIFFLLASGMSPGEMDQYVSLPDYTHSNVTAFLRDYDHEIIKGAIAKVKEFAKRVDEDSESKVVIKLASGILGILAAVNEEVEWSYWAILVVIFSVTFILCTITYRSFKTGLILLIPLYISQILCEFIMIFLHIDLNIDSLPVAAIGVGVGIDYAIYHMSRLKEECSYTKDLDKAILIALRTTGRIIIFTASTLAVGVIFWQFSALKFQAEMGLLILLLMLFNMTGALVFLPSLAAAIRPKWVKEMGWKMDNETGEEVVT